MTPISRIAAALAAIALGLLALTGCDPQRISELEAQQRAGRALLWDKAVDRSAWQEYREAQVAQKPYVYQTNS